MMLKSDFIIKMDGKNKRKYYHCFCDKCGKDRGYQRYQGAKRLHCKICGSSMAHKGKIVSVETRQKMSDNNHLKHGGVHPWLNKHHTPETKEILSKRQKEYCKEHGNQFMIGKSQGKHAVETINRISKKNIGKEPRWKGRIFIYSGPQGNIKLRSSYELFYAYWLDQQNIKWQYEPQFKLSNGKYFSPDFKLGNGDIIEIKGFFTVKGKEKWEMFCNDYPIINKKILFKSDLMNLGMKEK